MKSIAAKIVLTAVIFSAIVIGIVKGADAREKWLTKMKTKHLEKKPHFQSPRASDNLLALDEIEMATYHS